MQNEPKIDFVLLGDGNAEEAELDKLTKIAIDVGSHAATVALDAMVRVLNTAPGRAYPAAVAVAHAELEWKLKSAEGQMDKVTPGFAGIVAELKASLERNCGERFRGVADKLREGLFGS